MGHGAGVGLGGIRTQMPGQLPGRFGAQLGGVVGGQFGGGRGGGYAAQLQFAGGLGGRQWGGQDVGGPQQGWGMQDMVEWGVQMLKRVQEEEGGGKKKKKKRDVVDDNDEEEELVPFRFANISGEDDGETVICWDLRSGQLRCFNGNWEEFWSRQPKVSRPLRESYDYSFLRLDPVNPLVTLRDHDRGARRTIKQYAKVNMSVVKSKVHVSAIGLESSDVGLRRDYQECTGTYQLMSALYQYATNLFLIRRDDFSGLLMLKVLHDIKYFQQVLLTRFVGKARRDAKQVELVRHFIDAVLERNSLMGKQGKPPLKYKEVLTIAQNSANLVHAGSGVGLDWQLEAGTCGIDPYSLDSSGGFGAGDGSDSGAGGTGGWSKNAKKKNQGGGQGGGQTGGQTGGQGGQGAQVGGHGSGQNASQGGGQGGGGGTRRTGGFCLDWNRGPCRCNWCLLNLT